MALKSARSSAIAILAAMVSNFTDNRALRAKSPDQREDLGLSLADMRMIG